MSACDRASTWSSWAAFGKAAHSSTSPLTQSGVRVGSQSFSSAFAAPGRKTLPASTSGAAARSERRVLAPGLYGDQSGHAPTKLGDHRRTVGRVLDELYVGPLGPG